MSRHAEPRFLPVGDTALSVEFGDGVDRELNGLVLALDEKLLSEPAPGLIETVPTFRSLMIHYDPGATDFSKLKAHIRARLPNRAADDRDAREWVVPTCYEGELAPDLEQVSQDTGIAVDEVIELHAETLFHVYALGFVPGLPYLGDLPESLSLPRREDPRVRVPRGSVGIAGRMSLVYPVVSPGGWHLIGNTPIELFEPTAETPALFAPGDKIRFQPIDRARFDELRGQVEAGAYKPEHRLIEAA